MTKVTVLLLLIILSPVLSAEPEKDRDLSLSFFRTQSTEGHFVNIVFTQNPGNYHDFYLYTLALSKVLASYKTKFDFEVEGQLVRHVEDAKAYEMNAIIVLRWKAFFWDRFLDTSIAMGSGFSYATKVPEFELLKNEVNSNLMHCLMAEVAFGIPFVKSLEFIVRVHHRSGFWGFFNAAWGGSNHIGFGLKYLF